MNLAIIIAAFIFLIGALAPLFDWDLHKFNYLGWGLFSFALGHIWTYFVGPRSQ